MTAAAATAGRARREAPVQACAECGGAMQPRATGGRPQRYCGAECRRTATRRMIRERRRQTSLVAYPGRHEIPDDELARIRERLARLVGQTRADAIIDDLLADRERLATRRAA